MLSPRSFIILFIVGSTFPFFIPEYLNNLVVFLIVILRFWRPKKSFSSKLVHSLEDSYFHSTFVQDLSRMLSHSSHLNQPVQSPFQVIVQWCTFWVSPNPQVFSQDLTWLFYFPGVTLKFFSKFDVRMSYHHSNAFLQDLSISFHRWLNLSIFFGFSRSVSSIVMVVFLIIILRFWRPK